MTVHSPKSPRSPSRRSSIGGAKTKSAMKYGSKMTALCLDNVIARHVEGAANPKLAAKWMQKMKLSILRKVSACSKIAFLSDGTYLLCFVVVSEKGALRACLDSSKYGRHKTSEIGQAAFFFSLYNTWLLTSPLFLLITSCVAISPPTIPLQPNSLVLCARKSSARRS